MNLPKYVSTGQFKSNEALSAAAQEILRLIETKPGEAVLPGLSYQSGHPPSVVAELLTELFDANLITVHSAELN
jgi:DNA-binding IclR family transcriptional regulator